MEEHMHNITALCNTQANHTNPNTNTSPAQKQIIQDTLQFYRMPELHPKQIKYHKDTLIKQLMQPELIHTNRQSSNRFSYLTDFCTDNAALAMETEPYTPTPPSHEDCRRWVSDTRITNLSEKVRKKLVINRQNAAKEAGDEPPPDNLYKDTPESTVPSNPTPPPRRIRFNLIRHRNSSSNQTKLKQFQSFALALRNADQYIGILPYASEKQFLTHLSTVKQINNTDENKLKI